MSKSLNPIVEQTQLLSSARQSLCSTAYVCEHASQGTVQFCIKIFKQVRMRRSLSSMMSRKESGRTS